MMKKELLINRGTIKMYYIQRHDSQTKQIETVDEFTTKKEANDMRYEYVMSDRFASYRISSKPCMAWTEDNWKATFKEQNNVC